MKKNIFIVVFVLFSNSANADLNDEMNNFWNDLGGSSNSNSAYTSQSAGYYTGGSLNARAPVIQQQPFQVRAPSITAGCGGIDMFTGSFSHINLDQFVAQLKAIGSNSVGYAFQLALETLSPMISSVTNKLQAITDTINGFNINSCETAKFLVDGVRNKVVTAMESSCVLKAVEDGTVSDTDAGKVYCQSLSNQIRENEKLSDEEKNANINFTWQALKKNNYVSILGVETAQAFMSMVGTIIFDKKGVGNFIKPKGINTAFLTAFTNGGIIESYKCDESTVCLNLSDTNISISSSEAYNPRILSLLDSIGTKLKDTNNSQSLSESELNLIFSSSLPILRIMVNSVTNKSLLKNSDIAEIVSRDMVNKFLQDIANLMKTEVISLKTVNNNTDAVNLIEANIKEFQEFLKNNKNDIKSDIDSYLRIVEANQRLDQEMSSKVASHIKSVLDYSSELENNN